MVCSDPNTDKRSQEELSATEILLVSFWILRFLFNIKSLIYLLPMYTEQ